MSLANTCITPCNVLILRLHYAKRILIFSLLLSSRWYILVLAPNGRTNLPGRESSDHCSIYSISAPCVSRDRQTTVTASIPLTGSNCFCHQATFHKMSTEYKPDRTRNSPLTSTTAAVRNARNPTSNSKHAYTARSLRRG
jgi:hypothetical protein